MGESQNASQTRHVAVGDIKYYINPSTNIVCAECHQSFKKICLYKNIIPNVLKVRLLVDTPYGRKIATTFSQNCVKARFLESKTRLRQLRKRRVVAENFIRRILQRDDLRTVFIAQRNAENLETQHCTDAHDRKLTRLLLPISPSSAKSSVVNLSTKALSYTHVSFLSMGLVFALAPHIIPKRHIIAEIEDKLRHIKDVTGVNLARSCITSLLSSARPPSLNLNNAERAALRELKTDESIVILPADKGRATVVLNKEDYTQKILEILGDPSHFVELTRNPTPKSERDLVDILRCLKK